LFFYRETLLDAAHVVCFQPTSPRNNRNVGCAVMGTDPATEARVERRPSERVLPHVVEGVPTRDEVLPTAPSFRPDI
jgi:hypothetical protein